MEKLINGIRMSEVNKLQSITEITLESVVKELIEKKVLEKEYSGKWRFNSTNLPEYHNKVVTGKNKTIRIIQKFLQVNVGTPKLQTLINNS